MPAKSVKKTVIKLTALVVGMFGFGFALVPLYDVLCDVAGLNGKTSGERYEPVTSEVDTERLVKIQFVATNNDGMSWEFHPEDMTLRVNPGAANDTTFYAKNPTLKLMTAQAVPSISPSEAAPYFHKTECFCFNQQTLEAGKDMDMPLRFIVDQALPKHIKTITLSYTLFDVTQNAAEKKLTATY